MKYNKLSVRGLCLTLLALGFFLLLKILLSEVMVNETITLISMTVFLVLIPILALITAIRSSLQLHRLKKQNKDDNTIRLESGNVFNLFTISVSIFILLIMAGVVFMMNIFYIDKLLGTMF